LAAQPIPEPASPFDALAKVLNKYFYKPDIQAIRIALGALKSHYLKLGDPAWLFIVAPPGTGKTTMSIMGISELKEVHMTGDITESSLLSGFHGHAQPGILEKVGPTVQEDKTFTTTGDCVLLVKDFTTVLSMRREKRAEILSQLREVHDGEFRREFGTGVTKIWKGRTTVIAAVTPELDRHYSVFNTLGERFLQVRWHRPDSPKAGEIAMDQQGKEQKIRSECRKAVLDLFQRSLTRPPDLSPEMRERVAALAEIVAIGRTHVHREGYGSRDIEHVPEPEANTRISKALAAIAKGVAALNRNSTVLEQDLQDALRVGLDSLPEVRQRLLLALAKGEDVESVERIPRTVRKRALEDLEALGLIQKEPKPDGKSWHYRLAPSIAVLWSKANVSGA